MEISTVQVSSPTHFVKVVESNSMTQQFALNHEKFAQLATSNEFENLKPNLIEIDIKSHLNTLSEDGFLEVSVPVLGLTDFLATNQTWYNLSQKFPVPIAINQFGASSADFIVVKDIIGNQFELFINSDGIVEIPEQTTGLFSIITEITYIFSYDQIIDGRGFVDIKSSGAESGKLYLLPPPGAHDQFEIKITSAHLNDLNHKIVDQILKVPVVQLNDESKEMGTVNVAIKNLSNEQTNLLQIDLYYRKKNYHNESFGLDIALQKVPGISYDLFDTHAGWSTQNDSTIFTKQIGLSDYALTALVRNVFSEYDFSKALISGESFNISQKSGLNDFSLSPEAVGLYYDLFVSGVVKQTIPGEWLFEHVPHDRIENLNLDYAFLNSHDAALISNIVNDVKIGHFDSFSEHFYDPSQPSEGLVHETLYVVASNAGESFLPKVEAALHNFEDHHYFSGLIDTNLSVTDLALSHTGELLSNELALSADHDAIVIYYGDTIDSSSPLGARITGFDMSYDKLNLANLIDNHPELSKDSVRAEVNGEDVHVVLTNTATGEDLTVATLLGAHSVIQDPNPPPLDNFIEFS